MSRYSPPLAYWMWRQQQLGAPGAGGGLASGGVTPTPSAPVVIDAPTISGSPAVGSTLTASNGSWSAYPFPSFSYQWKKGGVDISGATTNSYVPVTGDIGSTLTVVVTATNSAGSASSTSAATAAVTAALAAPVNTVAPGAPTGSANTGQTLTAQTGTWTGNPTPTYTYVWKRAGTAIPGATASTYVVQASDEGSTLTVTITGTNSQGSASATSSATATITAAPFAPVNTVIPAISGSPWEGQTLMASTGAWNANPSPPTYAYQWKRAGTNISGATSSAYLIVSADVGSAITVAVTATNSQGSSTPAVSSSVSAISPPLVTAVPAGSALHVAEGDSITAGTATSSVSYATLFAGTDTTDITFSDQAVSGSTFSIMSGRASTVDALIASNPGKVSYVLSVMIGVNDSGSAPSTSTYISNLAAYCAARRAAGWTVLISTILPTSSTVQNTWIEAVNTGIMGFVASGKADAVVDLYNDPMMGLYAAAVNTTLYSDGVHPTALGQRYLERSVAATLSSLMAAPLAPSITSVSISGTAQQTQTGTATITGLAGRPTPSLAYQWKRGGTNISGATNSTYTFTGTDVGQSITVTVTATNSVSSTSSTSSAVTPTALPIPTISTAPAITGTATQGQTLTSSTGTWTNSPTSYAYRWFRGGVAISGATASTYVLTGTDVGTNITAGVIATNAGGSSTESVSSAVGPIAASATALLDTMTATPQFAYSTRKLKGSYSGSAIKVRRSSDNTTQDIGFDGSGNLDASALATFVGANSGFIDTWYDQSGNGYNLTQATTGNQPRIRNAGTTDTLNSQPVIRWPASGSSKALSNASAFPTGANHSVSFVIGQPDTNTGLYGVLSDGGATRLLAMRDGVLEWYVAGGIKETTFNPFSGAGAQASYLVTRAATGGTMRRGDNLMAANSQTIAIGASSLMVGDFGGSSFGGPIAEVIGWASVLTAADRLLLTTNHAAYWGTGTGTYQNVTIPPATSNSAPSGYTITPSQEYIGYLGWYAFDQTEVPIASDGWAMNGSTGTLARQVPSALTLTAYAVSACRNGNSGGSPTGWTFDGSNDGASWTTLDTRASQTGWTEGERRIYTIAGGSRGAYTYHRLNVTATTGLGIVGELEFIT